MENTALSVLIIDDSPDDAELPVRQLRAAGFRLKTQRIYNPAGMESALQKGPWDLVLSELSLLQFSAHMALDTLKRRKVHTPLIVVTRSISDDDLASIMAAGARDVIRKNYTGRLVPAVRRELIVADMIRELSMARSQVGDMEGQHQAMVSGTQEAVCYCHEGMHIEANNAYLSMFGYDSLENLEVIPVLNLIDKTDQKKFKGALRKISKGQSLENPLALKANKQDGEAIYVEAAFAPVKLKGEDTIQITFNDISARKATEDRLQYLTQRDALTGLYNRHFFTKSLTQAFGNAKKKGINSALIYIDLFGLEEISNSQGYTVSDGILLKITKLLRDHLGSDAMLARFGDEELTILLEGVDKQTADNLAEDLKSRLAETSIAMGNKKQPCACAVGTALISADLTSVHEAVSEAVSMSKSQRPKAKSKPKVKVAPAEPTPVSPAAPSMIGDPADFEQLTIPADVPAISGKNTLPNATAPSVSPIMVTGGGDLEIATALANNSFRLVFQPVVSMLGEADEMYEVLVRMVGSNNELINPGEFMPKAEASGQIGDIDCWVVQRTLESIATMAGEGRHVSYFVNISLHSLTNPSLASLIIDTIKNSGIDGRQLILEMSHPHVAENLEQVSLFINLISEAGCQISLDNSGPVIDTLLKLPRQSIKFLKFDGNVVTELAGSADNDALTAVMDMAKQLAIRTVATHIEDASSLSQIWPYGFDFVQGHYFQQPDEDMSYEFAAEDETTLSEEETAPTWSQ
ncbi:MAG: EAL domain-containing protein [Acidiferrobacterales bacterium]